MLSPVKLKLILTLRKVKHLIFNVQSRGLHGIQGPGTRTGSGLYFKWSAGSGSGLNLLLRVPGRFNIVWTMIMDSFMSDAKKKTETTHLLLNTHAVKCNALLVRCVFLLKNSLYYNQQKVVAYRYCRVNATVEVDLRWRKKKTEVFVIHFKDYIDLKS